MYKTLVIVSFFFTCLLIGITIGAVEPEPVLDTKGRKVKAGVKYFILTASIGSGGFTLINPNNTCPLNVVQEKSLYRGKPITFTPLDNDAEDVIFTSTDLNIKSIVNPITIPCNKTLVWSLKRGPPGVWFVVGGDEFSENTQSTFHIDKFGTGDDDYELSLCANICPGCPIVCNKLGLFEAEDDGYKHLAQNYELQPFPVQFKRA